VHFTTDGAALMAQDLTAGLTPWIFSVARGQVHYFDKSTSSVMDRPGAILR
jgi:hypothetical protein